MDAAPLGQLADVDMPLPPDWTPWLVALAGMTLLGLLITWTVVHYKRRSRASLARQTPTANPEQELERLLAQWQSNDIPPRELAYRLATLLRLALRLPQLEAQPPEHIVSHRERWPELINELAALRYRGAAEHTLRPEWLTLVRTWMQESRARS